MKRVRNIVLTVVLIVGSSLLSPFAMAQVDLEKVRESIGSNWAENIPTFPEVDEVRETPIRGLYEVVMDGDVVYTDIQGNYLILGELMDLRGQKNLTQERQNSLISKIDFDRLPLKDAIVVKRGNGERKLVIFEDPKCGFCHKFERDLLEVDDVTLYVFLYPILSNDSRELATHILCADDAKKAWEDWMVHEIKPAVATCDKAGRILDGNLRVGKGYSIKGTPTLIFTDGSRIPGAVPPETVNARFNEIAAQ